MPNQEQRLEALERYVTAMAAYTAGAVAGGLFWCMFLPPAPALFGIGITFLGSFAFEYYAYLKAKYQ